ncbi:response regulator [Sneathiella marina]|uniref:Response regulator n=1 Tax=Sneathiella marina TaxID=2950108 RepID=A0ABY4WAV9_9PROT|nr:response regulator [Sneathiella marina]USG62404.1 response regulator [Sneathiella marina]
MAKNYNFKKLDILFVDDNKNMHLIVKHLLQAMDITNFRGCLNANNALKMMKKKQPDILITDLKMASLDGFELIERIRRGEDGCDPYVPILVLSGQTEIDTVIKARNVGATEFLAKPASVGSLYDRLVWMVENPRPFIKADEFLGPDRRRAMRGYEGLERRE